MNDHRPIVKVQLTHDMSYQQHIVRTKIDFIYYFYYFLFRKEKQRAILYIIFLSCNFFHNADVTIKTNFFLII